MRESRFVPPLSVTSREDGLAGCQKSQPHRNNNKSRSTARMAAERKAEPCRRSEAKSAFVSSVVLGARTILRISAGKEVVGSQVTVSAMNKLLFPISDIGFGKQPGHGTVDGL